MLEASFIPEAAESFHRLGLNAMTGLPWMETIHGNPIIVFLGRSQRTDQEIMYDKSLTERVRYLRLPDVRDNADEFAVELLRLNPWVLTGEL